MSVIEVNHIHKRYGNHVAVNDISFTVAAGEIFGIVGPNGAGKTTTVEIIEGLRTPDRGDVRVLGLDPRTNRAEVRRRLGIQLQESQLPDRLKVREALDLYSSFYDDPADWRALMADMGLANRRNAPFSKLSGARSNGCRSRSPSSATRSSRYSTS
jgi:ABC-2 type transport system ATP-binding protein